MDGVRAVFVIIRIIGHQPNDASSGPQDKGVSGFIFFRASLPFPALILN